MSPAGFEHGMIAHKVSLLLGMHVLETKAGVMCTAETGFILSRNPDTVRAPDAAFLLNERVKDLKSTKGFFDGAPDLAVEVISPSEAASDIEAKVIDYLDAGTQLVWLIYPQTQTITVHQAPNAIRKLNVDDALTGAPLLPDFSIDVRDIFE